MLIDNPIHFLLTFHSKFCSGNSVYGHSIMDKSKHTNVSFCGIEKASKLINDPFFYNLEEFDKETFEVRIY